MFSVTVAGVSGPLLLSSVIVQQTLHVWRIIAIADNQ